MELHYLIIPKDLNFNGGYSSLDDEPEICQRLLIITDKHGNRVTLENKEISELFKQIKPTLVG